MPKTGHAELTRAHNVEAPPHERENDAERERHANSGEVNGGSRKRKALVTMVDSAAVHTKKYRACGDR